MNADELRERFATELFSPSAKGDLARAITESYLILCQCAVEVGVPTAEDVAAVIEHIIAQKLAAPEKASMVWEWMQIPDSYTKSKLWTTPLIKDVGRCIDVRRIKGFEGDERRLLNTFFEMRACCQMVRVIRNRNAHIDEYPNQTNQIMHEAYTVIRVYELHCELVGFRNNGLIKADALVVDDSASLHRIKKALAFLGPRLPEATSPAESGSKRGRTVLSVKDRERLASERLTIDSMRDLANEERHRLEEAVQRIVSDALGKLEIPSFDLFEEKVEQFLERVQGSAASDVDERRFDKAGSIDIAQAESQLIELRNQIRDEFKQKDSSFEGYNNILQRPVVFAALKQQCTSLEEFKSIPKLRNMMERNNWAYYEGQVKRFGDDIDRLLRSIDYDAKPALEDFDEDIPF